MRGFDRVLLERLELQDFDLPSDRADRGILELAPEGRLTAQANPTDGDLISGQIVIGDYTYQIQRMLASPGTVFAMRTATYLFPFVAELFNLAQEIKADPKKKPDSSRIFPSLIRMIGQMQGEEVEYLNTVLGNLTQVAWLDDKGQPFSRTLDKKFFDTHFQDRYDCWQTWLVFALKVQLRSFFAGALKLGAKLQSNGPAPTTPQPSPSPSPAG